MPLLLHTERTSQFGLRPSSTEPFQSSHSPIHQIHRRQQSVPLLRQASLTADQNPVATPISAVEWKNIIDEVKRKYLARKYRSCSMQCCEILGNLKDTSNIEPLHLIYLHFYAASSFEWCARPLSSSSTYRAELLHNAQTHYAEAEVLIAGMEWNVAERARSPSLITSPDSPSFSASSRVPDLSSTASSSPRTSVFCLDDEAPAKATRKARPKSKKKVSFSSLPQLFEFQPEPYIRPDSPTLGWEDPFFMAPSHEIDTPLSTSPKKQSSPASIIKTPCEAKANQARIMSIAEFDTPSNHTFDLELFLQTRTLNRFRGQLSALRDQVRRHRAAVDGLLAAPEETPKTRPQSSLDVLPNTEQSHAIPASPLSIGGDEKNLRDRIERLRSSGWRRKRFDSRRYEALREQVLGELEPCR
ncbi:hypothetical protein F5Y01DRAFT_301244 [Xylaria sp. FL0043]|nr:hypothetical protein F5Y01DRAFT_301244 [Xylaria sp. FL0043]